MTRVTSGARMQSPAAAGTITNSILRTDRASASRAPFSSCREKKPETTRFGTHEIKCHLFAGEENGSAPE